MTTTLQTRVDAKLKRDAMKTFEAMGLDMSTGIKMFLTQVVRTNSIPFAIESANMLPHKEKRSLVRETASVLKGGKGYASASSLHRDIVRGR